MADLIVERTVLGETSKRMVLAGAVGYKKTASRTLAIGNDWNVIKIGARFAVDSSGTPPNGWYISLGIGNPTLSHSILCGTWGNVGSNTGYITSGFQIGKVENGVYANVSNAPTLTPCMSRASSSLGAFIIELTRTSGTSFSINTWSSQGETSSTPDYSLYQITPEKFSQALFGAVPTGTGDFSLRNSASTTSSEATYGDLDTVFFDIPVLPAVEISDITAVKVS